jgi:hypothetical protein
MRAPRRAFALAAALASPLVPRAAAADPAWLSLGPGTIARVDEAPWPVFDEPEAALTASAVSLERDFTADLARPNDVLYEPVGVRVRVVRVLPGKGIAFVRALGAPWAAYAPVDRLFPEVPTGTLLRIAGGFAGFADFFPRLNTPLRHAGGLATGTDVSVLGMDAAPYDPESSDLVRIDVRVLGGPERGRTGWVAAGFTGVPVGHVPASADRASQACRCRIVRFNAK